MRSSETVRICLLIGSSSEIGMAVVMVVFQALSNIPQTLPDVCHSISGKMTRGQAIPQFALFVQHSTHSTTKFEYPTLAIRISGQVADVTYFPNGDHSGFRCLGGEGLSNDG